MVDKSKEKEYHKRYRSEHLEEVKEKQKKYSQEYRKVHGSYGKGRFFYIDCKERDCNWIAEQIAKHREENASDTDNNETQ